jgi:hypothetical protein
MHLYRRRIIRENEQQYLREKARREAELTQKLVRTSEGPAHHIVHVSAACPSVIQILGLLLQ